MNRRNFIGKAFGLLGVGLLPLLPKKKEDEMHFIDAEIIEIDGVKIKGFKSEVLFLDENIPTVKVKGDVIEYKWEGIAYGDPEEIKMLRDALSAVDPIEKGLVPEQVEKSIYDPELSAKVGYPTGSVTWTKKHLKMFENMKKK